MTLSEISLLFGAGVLAGALNAVAGGGTFISFPVLVALGLPAVAANATATIASMPGYFAGALAFREDIRRERLFPLGLVIAVAMVGGLMGALLLLATPSEAFAGAVPWLLLVATVLFAAGPRMITIMRIRSGREAGPWVFVAVLGIVCLYGGYFNGGFGILLLAGLGVVGYANLSAMNGLKSLMSTGAALVSAVPFAMAGLVHWPSAAVLAVATMTGAYVGGRFSRRLDPRLVRGAVIVIGFAMTVIFFISE